MQPFWEYVRQNAEAFARPWLILGKGPTFSGHARLDLSGYLALGLNHVCRARAVNLTHVTDAEVFDQAGADILARGGHVVVPYYPHIGFKPNRSWPLPRLLESEAVADRVRGTLRELDSGGRLLYYRSSWSSRLPHPECGPKVTVRHFSAVPAVYLLALAGVRRIRTLGVDGGKCYAPEFAGLTPLTNGAPAFDRQFDEIRRATKRYGIDFARLEAPEPTR